MILIYTYIYCNIFDIHLIFMSMNVKSLGPCHQDVYSDLPDCGYGGNLHLRTTVHFAFVPTSEISTDCSHYQSVFDSKIAILGCHKLVVDKLKAIYLFNKDLNPSLLRYGKFDFGCAWWARNIPSEVWSMEVPTKLSDSARENWKYRRRRRKAC